MDCLPRRSGAQAGGLWTLDCDHPASAEARRRLEHVAQVIAACGGNRELARGKLQHDYGTSYLLYYLFHS